MKRIKNINEVGMGDGYVLLKVKIKASLIVAPVAPNKKGDVPQLDFAEVIAIGDNCGKIEVGDIVVSYNQAGTEDYKWNEEIYSIVPRHNIKFFVKPSNFDNNGGKEVPLELRN